MLAPPTISVPIDPPSNGVHSVTPAISTTHELSAPPRFPHTRAQLTSIARQYRPLDNYDDEADDGGSNNITSAFVARVASLLDEEREDELKILLKDTFGPSIDDDEVGFLERYLESRRSSLKRHDSSRSTSSTSCIVTAMMWTVYPLRS